MKTTNRFKYSRAILLLLSALVFSACKENTASDTADTQTTDSGHADTRLESSSPKAELIRRTRSVMKMRVRENLSAISEGIHNEINKGLNTIFSDEELQQEFMAEGMTENLAKHFPSLLNSKLQADLIDQTIANTLKDIYAQDDKIHRMLKTLPTEVQVNLRKEFSTTELKKQLAKDLLSSTAATKNIDLADAINQTFQNGGLAVAVANLPGLRSLPYIRKIASISKLGGPVGMIISTTATIAIEDAIDTAKSNQAAACKEIFTKHSRDFSTKIKNSLQNQFYQHIDQILKLHE